MDGELWWTEFCELAGELTTGADVEVAAVGVSGMGPCVLVTDEEVRNYYDQHRAQFKGDFESSAASVRNILEGEQINRQFELWLSDARRRTNIEYHEEAFR